MPSSSDYHNLRGEIRLSEILATLHSRRRLIATCACLAALIAGLFAFTATPLYVAEVLIAPAEDQANSGALAGLAGQFGGLAALAGVNVGAGGNKGVALATLSSRELTEEYIRSNNLLPRLFYQRWDTGTSNWKPSFIDTSAPTLWDGNKLFNSKIRMVDEDKKTGLVTLSIEWHDPVEAATWANALVQRTNDMLRQKAINTSNQNIRYLEEQLSKTSIVELRQSIYRLLESEIKSVMLAQGSAEYAFKVVDPAVVPQEKSWPRRSLLVLLGLLAGMVLAMLYALLASPNK
ncbi:hypothetical protein ED208_12125 [Stagnimonas aquatica]|uniref:Polysaccharide chain length determinant N-terminal domain-containing protein n=1 Tax=Stagnimonas aquatica TaxID=2689987 RepID=A0A3N0V9Z0_9GAMM|nr:Wzz/FepE/Etk N-terminal domain-containing protein [Stagnimonas aquatica]ROH89148.1 hypothetical protein ED208_12125 [Stagnimonas aquatica]